MQHQLVILSPGRLSPPLLAEQISLIKGQLPSLCRQPRLSPKQPCWTDRGKETSRTIIVYLRLSVIPSFPHPPLKKRKVGVIVLTWFSFVRSKRSKMALSVRRVYSSRTARLPGWRLEIWTSFCQEERVVSRSVCILCIVSTSYTIIASKPLFSPQGRARRMTRPR